MSNKSQRNLGLNPAVIRWARDWSGRTLREVAEKFDKRDDEILAWESGEKAPTLRQARELAHFYERPFLEFLFSSVPEVQTPASIPDYRLHTDANVESSNRILRRVQSWAEAQRTNALGLFADLRITMPEIQSALYITNDHSPDHEGERIRSQFSFSMEKQIALTSKEARKLPQILRDEFEDIGILILRNPDLAHIGVRGICLAETPLPVVVYTNESPAAQAFSLAHELAHVLTLLERDHWHSDPSLCGNVCGAMV